MDDPTAEDIPDVTLAPSAEDVEDQTEDFESTDLYQFKAEFSLGTYWNWFLPSCFDVWSPVKSDQQQQIIVAYGARSFLYLLDLCPSVKSEIDSNEKTDWKLKYRDSLNVLNFQSPIHKDVFRYTTKYVTVAVFDKTRQFGEARIFVGSSELLVGVYSLLQRKTLIQNIPFTDFKRDCCRMPYQKKILSAAWLYFRSKGSTVFYSFDVHVVEWNVDAGRVSVLHFGDIDCAQSKSQVSCLSSLNADCTVSKQQHKLAVGYMNGRIVIIGFELKTGEPLSSVSLNGHHDDICSLSFSPYPMAKNDSFQDGLLCSVSRDSALKIWSCSKQSEIMEYRIINASENGRNQNTNNWFSASFLPRNSSGKFVEYEVMCSDKKGELLLITIPDKVFESKLRLNKVKQLFPFSKIHHTGSVFTIAINHQHHLALTTSKDYSLIVWDLKRKSMATISYTFSNGIQAIDNCLKDKRVAIASGSSVHILDFEPNTDGSYAVSVKRLHSAQQGNRKICSLIWNRKDFERLGQVIIGFDNGSMCCYDLNTYSICFRFPKSAEESAKIYDVLWLDNLSVSETTPVVLSLHQSHRIRVNFLSSTPQENLHKYLTGIEEEFLREHSAMALETVEENPYLFLGNVDGTVDVFVQNQSTFLFEHQLRFRPFNVPIVAMNFCPNTKWLAVTALHKSMILCFDLNQHLSSSESVVQNIKCDCELTGHQDRVSVASWSPFNQPEADILLASGSYDCCCIVWNVKTKQPLKCFHGHRSLIYQVKWCHFDSNYLFSAGEDNFFFWNWTQQADYRPSWRSKRIKYESLTDQEPQIETQSVEEVTPKISKTSTPVSTEIKHRSSAATIKALLPLSNTVENCSSKKEILDDIKWIYLYHKNPNENIPYERIYFYTMDSEIYGKYLSKELDYHQQNNSTDAYYMLMMMMDATDCIKRAIEYKKCDAFISNIAAIKSKKLWLQSLDSFLEQTQSSSIRWHNYHDEMVALIRLHCFLDLQSAVDVLLKRNLYRQALILSVVNLASKSFVTELLLQWHKFRLAKGDYEGAVKCAIACGNLQTAIMLLEQRRALCPETNANICHQYDNVIQLLKQDVE